MKQLLMAAGCVLLSATAFSQTALRKAQFNIDKSAVAVSGYDAVAYFTQNKAVKGDKKLAAVADGLLYYFSNQANKDLFLKDYKKYEPQYGGWCAYAMGASGDKVEVDPETFKIADGKLYLFYHSWTNNTLTKWNKDETKLKTNADKNWLTFFK
jgi:YHS domain-containing protein